VIKLILQFLKIIFLPKQAKK